MAIVKTTLGANTSMFSVTADTSTVGQYVLDSYTGLLNAVKTELPTHGWNLHDEVAVTSTNHVHTLVYEALNSDTITHKLMILRWDTIKQEINVSTCEYWNATTHVATNESYTYGNSSPIPWRQDQYDLIIFASQYWCIFQSFHINEPSQWAGIVEIEREDSTDIASLSTYSWLPYNVGTSVPSWGFISSALWMQGFVSSATSGSETDTTQNLYEYSSSKYNSIICFPRNKLGQTGFAAASRQSASTEFFTTPMPTDNPANMRGYRSNLPVNMLLSNYVEQGRTNQWDTTRKLVYTLKVIENIGINTVLNNRGALMGLKVAKPFANILNKISLPLDSKYYFDAAGTVTPHFVLNTHGYNLNSMSNAASMTYYENFKNKNLISNMTSFSHAIPVGKYVYALSGTSMYILDITQGALIGSNRVLVSNNVYTPVYDGNRYIYFSSGANLISKLDTRNNSIVASIAAGCTNGVVGNLCLTRGYLYYADNSFNTNSSSVIRRLTLSDMTTNETVTGFTSGTYTGVYKMMRDDFGGVNIFVSNGPSHGNGNSIKSWRIADSGLAAIAGSTYDASIPNQYSYPLVIGVADGGRSSVSKHRFFVFFHNQGGASYKATGLNLSGFETDGVTLTNYQNWQWNNTGNVDTWAANSNTLSVNRNDGTYNSEISNCRIAGSYVWSGHFYNPYCQVTTDQGDTRQSAYTNVYGDASNTGKLYCDGYRLYTNSGPASTSNMYIYHNIYTPTVATMGATVVQAAQILLPA